jgi:putative ABC transport system permease protein
VSVEEGLAKTLGLKLGDTLRFDIAGQLRPRPHHQPAQGGLGLDAGELLRAVPAGADADVPATYISAFRAPTTSRASTTR